MVNSNKPGFLRIQEVGVSGGVAHFSHSHTPDQVGAEPAGSTSAAIAAHIPGNPHPQYAALSLLRGYVDTTSEQAIAGSKSFGGVLRAQGAVNEVSLGFARLDFGVQNSSPRIVFEQPGNPNWQIDSDGGNFRWFTPGVTHMSLNPQGNLSIRGAIAIASAIPSTSSTTGALTIVGGAGIGGNLNISGAANMRGLSTSFSIKNSNYTLTALDYAIAVDCSLGNVEIVLPSAVGIVGRSYEIMKTDASRNTATLTPPAGQTVNGGTTLVLRNQWESKSPKSSGQNWFAF
jgi:hypothetical protein